MSESTEALYPQVHAILDVVAKLENRPNSSTDLNRDWDSLDRALDRTEGVLRRLAADRNPCAQHLNQHANLGLLAAEAALLRNRIRMQQMALQNEMMQKAGQALQRLRLAETEGDLAAMLTEEVVNLGFVRAMYSTVDEMRWVTRTVTTVNGEAERELLLRAGQQPPFRELRGLFEFEMVQQRRPILRRGIRKSLRVHPEIIRVTESDSYIAAPLLSGSLVTGFVSIDVNSVTGTVDEFDRDLVGLVCGGAGIALERIRAIAGATALQADVGRSIESLQAIVRGSGVSASSVRESTAPMHAVPEELEESEVLTRREYQVLRLIARGRTNSEIGQQLVISEGTAKTHVRNILRKLGASNRTHAAEMYRQQH